MLERGLRDSLGELKRAARKRRGEARAADDGAKAVPEKAGKNRRTPAEAEA